MYPGQAEEEEEKEEAGLSFTRPFVSIFAKIFLVCNSLMPSDSNNREELEIEVWLPVVTILSQPYIYISNKTRVSFREILRLKYF